MSFSTSISRTINAYESFHAKFNGMFDHNHSNINQFLEILDKVQTSTHIKINSIAVQNLKI